MASSVNSIVKEVLSSDAVKQIAKKAGVSTSDASSILSSALPELLSGASKQASSKSTLSSFVSALESHSGNDTSNLTSFFKNVDLSDGSKIVSHLLGNKSTTLEKSVAKTTNIDAKTVGTVLACAAPLVMSLLGKQATKKTSSTKGSDLTSVVSGLIGNDDLTSLATSLLGGKTTSSKKTTTKKASSVDLDDVVNIASKILKK